jgi:flagellar capping protein FliD
MGYSSLNTLEFSKINQVNSGITYGYLDLKALNSSTSANVVSSIPRTLKQISSIYQISIGAKGGTLSYSSASFAKAVNLQMKYDEALLGGLPESRIGLYEYVSATNTWRKVIAIQDSTQNMIFATLTKPGIYTLMATR